MNLFLIGYRGTGKSTVARILAARSGRAWVDADVYLESLAGRTIREIFATDGEPVFRDLESRVVAELARRDETIVALGGGAILREANRAALRGRGVVVWLQAAARTLDERLNRDPTTGQRRPALTALGGLAEIEQMLAVREPLYRDSADVVIDTEGRSPEAVADLAWAAWREREGGEGSRDSERK